jgi:hypothetical protein
MDDPGTLSTIASIISAFGAAMLFFRIQRELQMGEKAERVWLPVADWLLVGATLLSLLFVIVPLVIFSAHRLPSGASGAAAVLVAGYVFAILAHYRILFGANRSGPRSNPEPSELLFVILSVGCALAVLAFGLIAR